MENKKRVEIDAALLDQVVGGSLGFDPDSNGTYTMICGFSGQKFYGVSLGNCMEICKHGAYVPNTAEGEQEIVAWAQANGYI